MNEFCALALWCVMLHVTFWDPKVTAAAGRTGRTSVYHVITVRQLIDMIRPKSVHCTSWPGLGARAVPGVCAAFKLTAGISASKSAPAAFVLRLKAGTVLKAIQSGHRM